VAQQISQPLTVLDVGFAAGQRFDVLGIDQNERAPLLQHVEDGTPQHAGTLHSGVRHAMEGQPVTQC
jgi:hypothetical protein